MALRFTRYNICDFSIKLSNERQINCHKIVLAKNSRFFYDYFTENEDSTSIDFPFQVLERSLENLVESFYEESIPDISYVEMIQLLMVLVLLGCEYVHIIYNDYFKVPFREKQHFYDFLVITSDTYKTISMLPSSTTGDSYLDMYKDNFLQFISSIINREDFGIVDTFADVMYDYNLNLYFDNLGIERLEIRRYAYDSRLFYTFTIPVLFSKFMKKLKRKHFDSLFGSVPDYVILNKKRDYFFEDNIYKAIIIDYYYSFNLSYNTYNIDDVRKALCDIYRDSDEGYRILTLSDCEWADDDFLSDSYSKLLAKRIETINMLSATDMSGLSCFLIFDLIYMSSGSNEIYENINLLYTLETRIPAYDPLKVPLMKMKVEGVRYSHKAMFLTDLAHSKRTSYISRIEIRIPDDFRLNNVFIRLASEGDNRLTETQGNVVQISYKNLTGIRYINLLGHVNISTK